MLLNAAAAVNSLTALTYGTKHLGPLGILLDEKRSMVFQFLGPGIKFNGSGSWIRNSDILDPDPALDTKFFKKFSNFSTLKSNMFVEI